MRHKLATNPQYLRQIYRKTTKPTGSKDKNAAKKYKQLTYILVQIAFAFKNVKRSPLCIPARSVMIRSTGPTSASPL